MSLYFGPSLSYWGSRGTKVRSRGLATPSNALNKSKLVVLVHGYNNLQHEASDSYALFLQLQEELCSANANLVAVYWPGANWEGAAFYMQAIGKAKQVAPLLALDLYQAARARGYVEVQFIAHSLGCRLVLETIKVLSLMPKTNQLFLNRVVLMAGAVPTRYLQDSTKLKDSLAAPKGLLNMYSQQDTVLHYAFPLGQSAALEGFFPVALGRKSWTPGAHVRPPLKQIRNTNANHGDYWGGSPEHIDIKRQAARIINDFIPLGSPKFRAMQSAGLISARSLLSRESEKGRTIPRRIISGRSSRPL